MEEEQEGLASRGWLTKPHYIISLLSIVTSPLTIGLHRDRRSTDDDCLILKQLEFYYFSKTNDYFHLGKFSKELEFEAGRGSKTVF